MRTAIGSLVALAATTLLTVGFSDIAHAQTSRICSGNDGDCFVSETPAPGVRIVRPELYPQRPAHYFSNDRYTTLAEHRETRDRFTMVDLTVPPGGGPVPHTHSAEWEIFFVLQGTLNFYVGVNPLPPFNVIEQAVGPGTAVYAPKCRVMGFLNRSNAPAQALTFAMPAGIDNFFHLGGDEVVHFNAPVPPASPDQGARQAFWGERDANFPYIPGVIPPPNCPGIPNIVISSTTGAGRPLEIGPFGETRVVLASPTEVGRLTGATAFCGGGGPPDRPGGTVNYTSFSLPNRNNFPTPYISQFTEVVYALTGTLTFRFDNNRQVDVGPRTYVEMQPGVPFSVANFVAGSSPAQALSISVIGPPCQ